MFLHKPESMHYGKCPECLSLLILVLLHPDEDPKAKRTYHVRKHACGKRLEPVQGSVRKLPDYKITGSK